MAVELRRVAIVGVGLIGGSLGLAIRRRGLACEVTGVGRRQASLDQALARGAVDRVTCSIAEGVRGADLVVFATPVGAVVPLAQEAAPHLARGAVVTDVASTKGRLVAELEPICAAAGARFVGGHPLAGSERRSVEAACEDLFEGAVTVLTPTEATDAAAAAQVEALWRAVGARVIRVSPAEHDARLALTSHLPHAAAAALVLAVAGDVAANHLAPFVASGFRDATRIAGGDAALWRDILVDNADHVVAGIDRLMLRLADLRGLVERRDGEAIRRVLAQAKERRDGLIEGGPAGTPAHAGR